MNKKLFEITPKDKKVYEEELQGFLPDKLIDIHTHVWLDKYRHRNPDTIGRTVTWPSLVAKENPIEDLVETYELMFPGKDVTPLIFASLSREDDYNAQNAYIAECTRKHGTPSLLYAFPEWSPDYLLRQILVGRHLGIKVYLNLSAAYIPEKEIRIFDFIPHSLLQVLNAHKLILMLHIPRDGRLGDPVNIAQMLEIEETYPDLKVIYAHIGRAYCPEDFGNAFEELKDTKNLMFDFSATTHEEAMYRVLQMVGPKRMLFGSDLPILRMRMRRICEKGNYVNIVPKGMYGDVSKDSHMREVEGKEAEDLTFFMYEELLASKRALIRYGASKEDINQVFYANAKKLINEVSESVYGESLILPL